MKVFRSGDVVRLGSGCSQRMKPFKLDARIQSVANDDESPPPSSPCSSSCCC